VAGISSNKIGKMWKDRAISIPETALAVLAGNAALGRPNPTLGVAAKGIGRSIPGLVAVGAAIEQRNRQKKDKSNDTAQQVYNSAVGETAVRISDNRALSKQVKSALGKKKFGVQGGKVSIKNVNALKGTADITVKRPTGSGGSKFRQPKLKGFDVGKPSYKTSHKLKTRVSVKGPSPIANAKASTRSLVNVSKGVGKLAQGKTVNLNLRGGLTATKNLGGGALKLGGRAAKGGIAGLAGGLVAEQGTALLFDGLGKGANKLLKTGYAKDKLSAKGMERATKAADASDKFGDITRKEGVFGSIGAASNEIGNLREQNVRNNVYGVRDYGDSILDNSREDAVFAAENFSKSLGGGTAAQVTGAALGTVVGVGSGAARTTKAVGKTAGRGLKKLKGRFF